MQRQIHPTLTTHIILEKRPLRIDVEMLAKWRKSTYVLLSKEFYISPPIVSPISDSLGGFKEVQEMQSFSFYALRLPEQNHKLFSQPKCYAVHCKTRLQTRIMRVVDKLVLTCIN